MQLPSEIQAQAQDHALQLQPVATDETNLDRIQDYSSIYNWLATINTSKPLQSPGIKQYGVHYSHRNVSGKKCGRPLEEIDSNMASSTQRPRGRGGKASSNVRDAMGEEEEENSKTPTRRSTRQRSHRQNSNASGFADAKLNTVGPSSAASLPDRTIKLGDLPPFMPLPPSITNPLSTASQPRSESGASSVVSSNVSSKSGARSTSPVKKIMDLESCTHRVEYKALPCQENLPQDIRSLWTDLQQITTAMGVLPKELRDIAAFNNDNVANMYGLGEFHFASSSMEADVNRIGDEYLAVKKLLKRTSLCMSKQKHEPAWNEEVHRPVLDLALEAHFEDTLAVENVTKAIIDTAFTPTIRNSSGFSTPALPKLYVQSKMVDYSIHWVPVPNSSIAKAIDRFIHTPRPGTNQLEKTINQSTYTALRKCPAAIAIETKVGGGVVGGDPYVQLGIWNIAWLKRVRSILALDLNNVRTEKRVVTLPMIRVDGSDWKLSFLVDSSPTNQAGQEMRDDEGSSIIYNFPGLIGSTESIPNCYMLLASLRRIGAWVIQVYGPWWESVVGRAIVGS